MLKWLLLFNNHGTAQNYIGHVRWGCVFDNHGLAWDTAELKQALKGVNKLAVVFFQGPMGQEFLLTEEATLKLVGYNWARGNGQMTGATVLNWEFLLRFQSEGLRVERLPG